MHVARQTDWKVVAPWNSPFNPTLLLGYYQAHKNTTLPYPLTPRLANRNNHHHLLHAASHTTAAVMWSNALFLFFLSLLPFSTNWMVGNRARSQPHLLSKNPFQVALTPDDGFLHELRAQVFKTPVEFLQRMGYVYQHTRLQPTTLTFRRPPSFETAHRQGAAHHSNLWPPP